MGAFLKSPAREHVPGKAGKIEFLFRIYECQRKPATEIFISSTIPGFPFPGMFSRRPVAALEMGRAKEEEEDPVPLLAIDPFWFSKTGRAEKAG